MSSSAGGSAGTDPSGGTSIPAGDWMLDLDSHRLVRGDEVSVLNPKELSVLRHLLQAAPALVTTDELLARSWPGVVVGDHVLHEVISRLRRLLGDDARHPGYIETLPRRGYRWIAAKPSAAPDARTPAAGRESIAVGRTTPAHSLRSRVLTRLVTAAVVAGTIIGIVLLWRADGDPHPPQLRVAVLPFEVLSGETDPHLAEGLALSVQSQLGKLPDLVVLARSAVTRTLETSGSLPAVANALNASHAVEGTIASSEDGLRVVIQLVDPKSHELLWGDEYRHFASETVSLGSVIAIDLAEALGLEPTPAVRARIGSPMTTSVAALQLFEQASPERLDASHPAQNRAAIELLQAAVELDPGFAEALAWQSWREVWSVWNGAWDRKEAAVSLAEQAMALAPDSGMPHYAMGRVHVVDDRIRLGTQFFRRAAELAPSQSALLGDLSLFEGLLGNLEASLDAAVRSVQIDPRNLDSRWTAGIALRRLGEHELAEAWLRRSLEELPGSHWSRRVELAMKWLQMARGHRLSEDDYRALVPELVNLPQARSGLASQLLLAGHWALTEEWLRPVAYANPHLRSGMDDNPMARSVRTQLGFALLELGEREEALALLNGTLARAVDYVDRGGERPSIPLEIAAVHAALGNRELSLAWLDRAYDAGIREHRFIRIDPMFASLRESEAFQKRLERMAKDVAVKLDNARELGLLDELDRIMGAAGSG